MRCGVIRLFTGSPLLYLYLYLCLCLCFREELERARDGRQLPACGDGWYGTVRYGTWRFSDPCSLELQLELELREGKGWGVRISEEHPGCERGERERNHEQHAHGSRQKMLQPKTAFFFSQLEAGMDKDKDVSALLTTILVRSLVRRHPTTPHPTPAYSASHHIPRLTRLTSRTFELGSGQLVELA